MRELWTLVHLRGQPVLLAVAKATAAGFAVYTTIILEWRRRPHGRGGIWTATPAYPTYALLGPGVDLTRLRARFERLRVRPLTGEGATWTDAAVEGLRALEASWHLEARRPQAPRVPWPAGEPVCVASGLFFGRRGHVSADDGGHLVTVSLAATPGLTARPADTPVWRRATLPAACLAAGA